MEINVLLTGRNTFGAIMVGIAGMVGNENLLIPAGEANVVILVGTAIRWLGERPLCGLPFELSR